VMLPPGDEKGEYNKAPEVWLDRQGIEEILKKGWSKLHMGSDDLLPELDRKPFCKLLHRPIGFWEGTSVIHKNDPLHHPNR